MTSKSFRRNCFDFEVLEADEARKVVILLMRIGFPFEDAMSRTPDEAVEWLKCANALEKLKNR